METLLVSQADGVRTLTINRPEKRNSISPQVIKDLHLAFREADQDQATIVVVLTGAGDKAFCAGADLMGGGAQAEDTGPLARFEGSRQFADLFRVMAGLGKPIVGRVNGHALAGGLGLMLGCDLIIAADTAEFGTPEINIGLFPYVIMATIARNVPRKACLELLLTGDRINAQEAHRIGLINRVVPKAELDQAVNELTGKLKSKSPAILRLGRRAFYTMSEMHLSEALEYLNGVLTVNGLTEDMIEGVMAFFQKRPPQWKGR
ncbi:MAG: enoyl-CoA hydratase/isomerase family protein [Nitrospirae bacterium]|nr:enoyl-CoA hydratase/isomerase family protein [Nitrospirota bacterium]